MFVGCLGIELRNGIDSFQVTQMDKIYHRCASIYRHTRVQRQILSQKHICDILSLCRIRWASLIFTSKCLTLCDMMLFTFNRIEFACTTATDKTPDRKVHGANMGPIWGRQGPSGPHFGSMNLAIWDRSLFLYIQVTWKPSQGMGDDVTYVTHKCVPVSVRASYV